MSGKRRSASVRGRPRGEVTLYIGLLEANAYNLDWMDSDKGNNWYFLMLPGGLGRGEDAGNTSFYGGSMCRQLNIQEFLRLTLSYGSLRKALTRPVSVGPTNKG